MNLRRERPGGDAPSSSAQAAVLSAIVRIEGAIAEENAALRSGHPGPVKQYIERKNQGLLELSNAIALLGPSDRTAPVVDSLARFVGRLEENKRLLQIHYDALKDLARVFSEAAEEAMSDRTYALSRPARSR